MAIPCCVTQTPAIQSDTICITCCLCCYLCFTAAVTIDENYPVLRSVYRVEATDDDLVNGDKLHVDNFSFALLVLNKLWAGQFYSPLA